MPISRTIQMYAAGELIEELLKDCAWDEIRAQRETELKESDWRFMSDRSPSQEWIDYRQFMRDLPQNYDTANDAADAWNEYEIPE